MKTSTSKQVNFLMGGFIAGLFLVFLMPFPVVWSHFDNDHVSYYDFYCPPSVKEGDSVTVRVRRESATLTVGNNRDIHFKGWDATLLTQTDTADRNDYTHIDEKKWLASTGLNIPMEFVIQTTEDTKVEGDEQFTVNVKEARIKQVQERSSGSDLVHRHHIGPADSDDTSCTITIQDDDVGILDVSVISRPADGTTYKYNETIFIDVTFNKEVIVSGNIHVTFWLNGKWRGAGYQSGSVVGHYCLPIL